MDYEDQRALWSGWPSWELDHRLNCGLCGVRTRMPGHALCVYCDRIGVEARTDDAIREFEALLEQHRLWSIYQATHLTEGEASA